MDFRREFTVPTSEERSDVVIPETKPSTQKYRRTESHYDIMPHRSDQLYTGLPLVWTENLSARVCD